MKKIATLQRSYVMSGVGTRQLLSYRILAASLAAFVCAAIAVQGADLTWTGAQDGNWDTTTQNWSGDNTTYADSDTVLFDPTGANRSITVQAGGVLPGGMTVSNTVATPYVFGGGPIGGAGSLVKNGDGTLTLATNNTYSGGTTLNAGKIVINHEEALSGKSGALTTIALNGGELDASGLINKAVYTHVAVANTATLAMGHNLSWYGNISGAGELTITQPGASATAYGAHYGNLTAFTGTLILQTDRKLNVRNTGSAAMTVNLKGTSWYNGWGPTHSIGALSGEAGTTLAGQNAALTTLSVGALNTSTTFRGTIQDYNKASSQLTAFTKVGTGTLTLTGTNTYSSATAVSNGGLIVHGDHSAAPGLITVASGGRLGGDGTIGSDVNFQDGAKLVFDPGWTLTLGSGSTLGFESEYTPLMLVQADGTSIDWGALALGAYTLVDGAGTIDFTNISTDVFAVGDRQAYFQAGSLKLVVVPEPGTFALTVLGVLTCIGMRRFRR